MARPTAMMNHAKYSTAAIRDSLEDALILTVPSANVPPAS